MSPTWFLQVCRCCQHPAVANSKNQASLLTVNQTWAAKAWPTIVHGSSSKPCVSWPTSGLAYWSIFSWKKQSYRTVASSLSNQKTGKWHWKKTCRTSQRYWAILAQKCDKLWWHKTWTSLKPINFFHICSSVLLAAHCFADVMILHAVHPACLQHDKPEANLHYITSVLWTQPAGCTWLYHHKSLLSLAIPILRFAISLVWFADR